MTDTSTLQERVAEERAELTSKLTKFVGALGSELALTMEKQEFDMLRSVMLEYQNVLTHRLRNDKGNL